MLSAPIRGGPELVLGPEHWIEGVQERLGLLAKHEIFRGGLTRVIELDGVGVVAELLQRLEACKVRSTVGTRRHVSLLEVPKGAAQVGVGEPHETAFFEALVDRLDALDDPTRALSCPGLVELISLLG